MTRKARRLCGPLLLAAAGCAPQLPTPSSPPVAQAQPQGQRPDTFMSGYAQSIADESARLAGAGLGDEILGVRAVVDRHLPPGNYTLQATGATPAILRRLRVESVANYMVRTGYRRRHLANPAQAAQLVTAAAGLHSGPEVENAIAIFAPAGVVADLVRVDDRPDGSASLVYRIVEPLKNAPPAGTLFQLPLRGPSPGQYPPPPQPGEDEFRAHKRVVLFLQPPETVIAPRAESEPAGYRRVSAPMPLEGDRVLPGYHSGSLESTLTSLRAAIRTQQCAPGYVPVGKPLSTPRC